MFIDIGCLNIITWLWWLYDYTICLFLKSEAAKPSLCPLLLNILMLANDRAICFFCVQEILLYKIRLYTIFFFDLLYGHKPRDVFDLLAACLEGCPSTNKNEIQYILTMRTKFHTPGQIAQDYWLQAKQHQQCPCNRDGREDSFFTRR